MQLAILHYHLNRGGVTQVIQSHLRGLASAHGDGRPERVVVLYGGRRDGWPRRPLKLAAELPIDLIKVDGLDYDQTGPPQPEKLAKAIRKALTAAGCQVDQTVIHGHNHALGKNTSLPGAIERLATDGYRFLLQIHDFIEDFRPENYGYMVQALCQQPQEVLAGRLYPQSPAIHYAALTGRDERLLQKAGVPADRLHLLPNPIAGFHELPPPEEGRPAVASALGLAKDEWFVVYPVRAIRRKNLGEMLLLSALDPRQARYAVTLAPLNPVEAESFNEWRDFARALKLPCEFDIGADDRLRYEDILAAADSMLTTSVAEGFGLVFLETWLAGRPLVGRNLPGSTDDFKAAGVQFDGLYDRLNIPIRLVGEAAFRRRLGSVYRAACAAYRRPSMSQAELDEQIDSLIVDETVDFAALGPTLQREVIDQVRRKVPAGDAVRQANPELCAELACDAAGQRDTIQHNAAIIRQHYCLKATGKRLAGIYRSIIASPHGAAVEPLPHGETILDAFLHVRRLQPVRIESWHPTSPSCEV